MMDLTPGDKIVYVKHQDTAKVYCGRILDVRAVDGRGVLIDGDVWWVHLDTERFRKVSDKPIEVGCEVVVKACSAYPGFPGRSGKVVKRGMASCWVSFGLSNEVCLVANSLVRVEPVTEPVEKMMASNTFKVGDSASPSIAMTLRRPIDPIEEDVKGMQAMDSLPIQGSSGMTGTWANLFRGVPRLGQVGGIFADAELARPNREGMTSPPSFARRMARWVHNVNRKLKWRS